jgi:flavorubredoxin
MAASPPSSDCGDRRVIQIPIEPGLICLRGLSPRRLRFEVEYGLERGTSANSFLFSGAPEGASDDKAQDSLGRPAALLVHPPGTSFAEPYLAQLSTLVPADTELQVVVSNVNPNRVALLHQLGYKTFPKVGKLLPSKKVEEEPNGKVG